LTTLVGLRYRLAWARARSRPGRLVLFGSGYLVLACAVILFALGGVGAAAAAIRQGRADHVATIVLTGLYLNTALMAVFLGLGVTPAFSDHALRRYPLSRATRLAARHTTALLEPLWVIVFALTLGVAVGFSAQRSGSMWFALPVTVLFVLATYLMACLIASIGAWILGKSGGPLVVIMVGMSFIMAAPLAPAWIARVAARPGGVPFRAVLDVTPPLAAADAMTAPGWSGAAAGIVILIVWCVGLGALLVAADRLPRHARSAPDAPARWDHPADRVAALFGPTLAPLAGKMLRYYLRSPQTRYNYPLALPLVGLMIATNARRGSEAEAFLFVLGIAPAIGVLGTGTLSMNLFGFDGHGFRRYFLLPVRAVEVLRTAALVSLIPGALLLTIGFVAWLAFSPGHTTLRMAGMLLCAGFGGLLFFNALALWSSILAPRAIPFDLTFGNKLSPAANLVFVAAMVVFFGLTLGLRALGVEAVLGHWWVAPLFLALSAALHVLTVNAGSKVFVTGREQMLATIEGH
jgi:hypothetical protein